MVLGLVGETKTADDLRRHPDCVVNIPSPDMWECVEKLAPVTGKNPVPESKRNNFVSYHTNFLRRNGLLLGDAVKPMGAKECPVHLEARVVKMHELSRGASAAVEWRNRGGS